MPDDHGSRRIATTIYAWMLRPCGTDFRERYGAEALQLFRDRWSDERGAVARIRLWLDLLWDMAMSVPKQRLAARPREFGIPAGMPAFRILEGESLSLGAALAGFAMSAIAFAICWLLMTHWSVPAFAAGEAAQTAGPRPAAGEIRKAADQAAPPEAPPVRNRRVVEAIAENVQRYYVDRDSGQRIAQTLVAKEKAGEYDGIPDGQALASLLTKEVREIANDRHLSIAYFETPLRQGSPGPQPGARERYAGAMKAENCTFRRVEIRANNVGYLKLDSFPDPEVCETTARAAMARVNEADAVIFDLRDNRGGYPEMVSLIAAYLFDHPEYLYNPREATTAQSWTRSPVPGSRLADKAVFVLISARTFSGAEHFSYDLKMLKRATLVGETTGGAAHSAAFHRIDDHFGIGIPEVRAINPFGADDWEGVGVEPDVKVSAADALPAAVKLAQKEARKIEALRRLPR